MIEKLAIAVAIGRFYSEKLADSSLRKTNHDLFRGSLTVYLKNKDVEMSASLVDETNDQINDELINLISRAISASDSQTKVAIETLVPHFLDSFLDVVANKLGAEALFQAITSQDDSILEDLNDQLVEDNYKSFANSGTFSLNSLYGIRRIQNFVDIASTGSGLSHSAASMLLGIVLPIILAVIKRKLVSENTLNTPELINLFREQKESFAESLSASLSHVPEPEDELITPVVSDDVNSYNVDTDTEVEAKPAVSRTLIILLLISILLLFGNQLFLRLSTEPMSLPDAELNRATLGVEKKTFTTAEKESLEALKIILDSVTSTLSTITNPKTAKSKLPDLAQYADDFDRLSQKMSANVKPEAAALVTSSIPQMEVYYERIKKIPGGQIIVGPVLDDLFKKLVNTFI